MNKTNFNGIIKDCVKNIKLHQNRKSYTYNNEDEYYSTLKKEIGDFSIPISERKTISVIVFNPNNNDGAFSASIAYNYINEKSNKAEINLIGIGEGKGNILLKKQKELTGKNILIVDLQYNDYIYKELGKICNKVYGIDNHFPPKTVPDNVKVVSSNGGHGSCALVWKIFYPSKKVPDPVKLVDLGDSKKQLKGLSYSNFFTSALTFRYTRSPFISKNKWSSGEPLNDIWNIIESGNTAVWTIIGNYMNEALENAKEQIAKNAVVKNVQGFKAGVLNFLDPVLYKRVGRQINTNLQGKIDFAMLWGWEHSNNIYKISIIDDHKQTKINIPKLAEILGKIGGTPKKGGGFGHVGNFYWPRNKKHDIWDLFEKNLLSDKDKKEIMK